MSTISIPENIEEICKVFGKQLPNIAPESFQKMMCQVVPGMPMSSVPWHNILPEHSFVQAKDNYEHKVQKIIDEIGPDIKYYEEIYTKTSSVFKYLKPAKVDAVKLKLYSLNEENKVHLSQWRPDKYGFLPVPEYSLCESVTGRMKIKSGPNILLLPKKLRDIVTSRFGKNGNIWYLDYVSLEPRVALAIKQILMASEKTPLPMDIYALALKTLKLSNEISRETIKQIVLSQLYGQSKSTIIETLEKYNVRDPDEVVEMVNDFFGIDTLRQFILQGYQKTSGTFLRTFYGRHLTPEDGKPHALLNYYVQSTAVDIALLGFAKILEKLSETKKAFDIIVPIFILHDALILDVHKDVEHLIPKLCILNSVGVKEIQEQTFWMTGKKL